LRNAHAAANARRIHGERGSKRRVCEPPWPHRCDGVGASVCGGANVYLAALVAAVCAFIESEPVDKANRDPDFDVDRLMRLVCDAIDALVASDAAGAAAGEVSRALVHLQVCSGSEHDDAACLLDRALRNDTSVTRFGDAVLRARGTGGRGVSPREQLGVHDEMRAARSWWWGVDGEKGMRDDHARKVED
jgi:hypothetical protein